MTTVTAFMPGARARRDTDQRLTVSLALSVIAHVIVIAVLAGLLKPMLAPVSGRVGQALPIEVALVGVRPIAFTAPPEAPPTTAELQPAPDPIGSAASLPTTVPPAPRAKVPLNAPPLGVSIQSDVSVDAVSADSPPPPGNTSVSPIADSERLGHLQALRLAQRFPQIPYKVPRLREPLIVPYPPRAARAHAEARTAALLLVDANGKVVETTLFPDEPLFGPTVMGALSGVRLAPAETDAKAIPYWVILEFVFNMGTPSVRPRSRE